MPVRSWFPTQIYDAQLVEDGGALETLRGYLLEECLRLRDIDDEGRDWCAEHYPDGYTSYASYCRMQRMSSTFMELEAHLDRHVASFARSLQYDLDGRDLAMTDCWVNVMPRHATHGLHLHPTSTISGTFYVQTPPGASAIKFEDPRLAQQMAAPPRRETVRDRNRTFVHYQVDAGHVVLFESFLRHEVPPSRIDEERVSVSFNYSWF